MLSLARLRLWLDKDPGLDLVLLAVDDNGLGVLAGDLQVPLALDVLSGAR